ncbi:piggyBac transposable element-derived protein 3-like [Hydra vulgaris]|uniref:PiggyBac transposable element-derived protein 3-like n=1 Tax=Hydra vulgaris TaxID=6087 RepID=A0ABM4DCY9_HYDVU
MLLRNLDLKAGLCNGTRMKVCALHNNYIDAKVFTGVSGGKQYYTAAEAAKIILEDIPLGDSSDLSDYSDDKNFELDKLQAEQQCNDELSNQVEVDVSEYDFSGKNDYNVEQYRKWSKIEKNEFVSSFSQPEGPVKVHFADQKPVDSFLKYFDNEIMDSILFQSNLYINQTQKGDSALSKAELFAFMGFNMVMGYHELPSWKHYWNGEQDSSVPFISNALSRDRFLQILSNIHVNDNNADPDTNTDKLYKMRPLIDSLNKKFTELYSALRSVSINESMILFKGRSSLRQYISVKPIKRGYKLWSLADMDGYLYKLEVYQGKDSCRIDPAMSKYFGLGEKVIYQMTKSLQRKFHEVFIDYYFTSVPLMKYLISHQVLSCGTLRTKRKYLPQDFIKDRCLKRGDFDYRISKDRIVVFTICNAYRVLARKKILTAF